MKHLDPASTLIMLVTITLFIAALFEHGLTKDMLLESAVFLVSVKLVHAAYKASVSQKKLEMKLDRILEKLED
jgi:hypothetical protein